MAIRRGPLAVPEAATSVFSVLASRAAAGTPSFDAGSCGHVYSWLERRGNLWLSTI